MGWTIASTISSIVSIIFAIISINNAKKARQYKEEVVDFKNVIEIKGIAETFKEVRLKFVQETRKDDWFKGKEENLVISPMENVLAKISAVYPIMDDSSELKIKVKTVSENIVQFYNSTKEDKKKTFAEMIEIEIILQEVLHEKATKAVGLE